MEFILCQDKSNKSPLVLSEFMGTAPSFSQALTINPHDLLDVAHAINRGLTMSDAEKAERHTALLDSIVGHTSHTWAATVLRLLLENVGSEHTAHQTPGLDLGKVQGMYKKANKRLLMFDYDVSFSSLSTELPLQQKQGDADMCLGHSNAHRQSPLASSPHRAHPFCHRQARRRPQKRRLSHFGP